MTKISVRIEGRYEVKEDSFSRTYEWQPGCVVLECDCGQELTLPGTSTAPTCRCGADHSAIVRNLQDREGRLRHVVTHPWQYATRDPPLAIRYPYPSLVARVPERDGLKIRWSS